MSFKPATVTEGKNRAKITKLANPPSLVQKGKYKFLIMDAPTDDNLGKYLQRMSAQKVKKVVRACEPSYDTSDLRALGIDVLEMSFADGAPPSDEIISKWIKVVEEESSSGNTVAVHCVAGLGRAPVLVAIALVELAAMKPYDAVDLIRKFRKGAINQRQLKYLGSYEPTQAAGYCICM